jgi:hypothetical protein
MRRIICGVGSGLDGYIARPDGSLDFLHLRPSNYSMGPFFKTIDVGADSGRCRSAFRAHADHSFRAMSISDSGGCRSLIPG